MLGVSSNNKDNGPTGEDSPNNNDNGPGEGGKPTPKKDMFTTKYTKKKKII
jgi:hypothetical protein